MDRIQGHKDVKVLECTNGKGIVANKMGYYRCRRF